MRFRTLLSLLLVALLFVGTLPAVAQQTTTIVITEAQIKSSYAVAVSPALRITEEKVDLQVGQIVISATLVPQSGALLKTVTTLKPNVTDGYLNWVVIQVLVNGEEATDALSDQINTALLKPWRAYARTLTGQTVTKVDITETTLTITVTSTQLPTVTPVPTAAAAAPNTVREAYVFGEALADEAFKVIADTTRSLANTKVDFQPGKVIFKAQVIPRRGNPINVEATMVPVLENGSINWTLPTVLVGGQPANAANKQVVEDVLKAGWARFVRNQTGGGKVDSVTITENVMSIVVTVTVTGK
jgi:hypothetical protein